MLFLCFLFFSALSVAAADDELAVRTGVLEVVATGLQNDRGQVLIALSNSKENYDSRDEAYRGAEIKIKEGRAVYFFKDLPYGSYAIKLFHDENGNGKLDGNFLGIPKEDYGFSNNARGRFGPAAYAKARFELDAKRMRMEVKVE